MRTPFLFFPFLVVLLPLTLASDTQHRFRVYVEVGGEDQTINTLMSSHLKRELRALGDVDVIGKGDNWAYQIKIYYVEVQRQGGVKTGALAIADSMNKRVASFLFKDIDITRNLIAVYPGLLGSSYWYRDDLQNYCISIIGRFNDEYLQRERAFYNN